MGTRIISGAAPSAPDAERPRQGRDRGRDRGGRRRGGGRPGVHVDAAPGPVGASVGGLGRVDRPAARPASKLTTLAAFIEASSAAQPGNASLEIARQVNGGKLMQVVYALYTDSGRLYLGDDKQTLMAEVAGHENQADFTNARELAAARYAATGNLAAAVKQMVSALPNDYYDSLAERKAIWAKGAAARAALEKEKGMKTPIVMPTGKLLQQTSTTPSGPPPPLPCPGGRATRRSGSACCACCRPFPRSPSSIRRPAGSPR